MASANDTAMADATSSSRRQADYSDLLQTSHSDAFAFSPQEKHVLELYGQLRELELQQSLLQAQDERTMHVHVLRSRRLNYL